MHELPRPAHYTDTRLWTSGAIGHVVTPRVMMGACHQHRSILDTPGHHMSHMKHGNKGACIVIFAKSMFRKCEKMSLCFSSQSLEVVAGVIYGEAGFIFIFRPSSFLIRGIFVPAAAHILSRRCRWRGWTAGPGSPALAFLGAGCASPATNTGWHAICHSHNI